MEVSHPEIRASNHALDFGPGFYTTLNKEQAVAFANIVRERKMIDSAFVSEYAVDIDALKAACAVKTFESPDEDWLDFVCDNRNGKDSGSDFDAVLGPVANDQVFKTFIAYQNGTLTKEETIARLKVRSLYNQLTFKSEKALTFIKFVQSFKAEGGAS